jgi:catalase
MQDVWLLEKLAHFDREVIPERRMHAKGSGAYGTFTVTHDISRYTRARIFSAVGKKTELFARFTTVAGERGAADAERDIRGFALKFYTEEGNWDMVGNNTPVFFLRDPLKFPDLNHAVKRDPRTNMRSPRTTGISGRSLPGSAAPGHHRHERPRHSAELSPHARLRLAHLQLHQRRQRALLGQVPLQDQQGIKNLTDAEAKRSSARTARATSAICYEAIERGDFPKWTLYVQIMPEADAAVPYNPFDLTKVWPHKRLPADRSRRHGTQPQPGELLRRSRAGGLQRPATSCPASASRRTRCCRRGSSPTATRSATGSASITTRFR